MPKPTDRVAVAVRPGSPQGDQRWVLTADGGVRAEGGAPFFGSYPGLPAKDRQGSRYFIDIYAHEDGQGYTLYGNDDTTYKFRASGK